MRKLFALIALAGAVLGGANVAHAAGNQAPWSVTVRTTFDGASPFDDSTLAGCASGTVDNGRTQLAFTKNGGHFAGQKVFTCDGSAGGFTVWLNASFGPDGSTGTWAVVSSWGTYAGLRGQGKLVGTPAPAGIDDTYSGWLRVG